MRERNSTLKSLVSSVAIQCYACKGFIEIACRGYADANVQCAKFNGRTPADKPCYYHAECRPQAVSA